MLERRAHRADIGKIVVQTFFVHNRKVIGVGRSGKALRRHQLSGVEIERQIAFHFQSIVVPADYFFIVKERGVNNAFTIIKSIINRAIT